METAALGPVEAWLQERPARFRIVEEVDSPEVVLPLCPSLLAMELARAQVQVLGLPLVDSLEDNKALGALSLAVKQVSAEALEQAPAHRF